ncbi:MAG: 50S ribosomal protein L32 [Clostridia bacterium]|nr:50S ribosomal protein L32 [Clostridia bacterium]MCL6521329.1 50S ribosomal protein L32 [Bacillota bacterium]
MGNPKRRFSKSRRDKRAAHWKLAAPNLVPCPHCHEMKMPHRACPHCGYYGEREVVRSGE